MKDVFERFYDNYHHDLYRYIFYMVKNKQLTEDLVQEVYIRVLQSYQSFRKESNEKTWLFSIARHVTIDFFRKQNRRRNRILDYFDWGTKGESIQDPLPEPEDIVIKDEALREVYDYLDVCSEDQKNVLILRFIQSFSIKETAEILNMSISKVKTTQHRGIKKIRKLIEEKQKGGDAS